MTTPRLFNATGEPVFVLVGDARVLLPEAPEPLLLHTAEESSPFPVLVSTADGGATVGLESYAVDKPLGLLGEPPVIDGVVYLVSMEAVIQFPHRTDFVAPCLWQWVPEELPELEPAGITAADFLSEEELVEVAEEEQDDLDDYRSSRIEQARQRRVVLSAVTRAVPAVATPDMEILQWEQT